MTSHAALPLAATAMQWITGHLEWAVAGLIVVVSLLIYGGKDLLRFSAMRARAVASVCFHESIRRRVLWLTPLAIVGVVLISQFQRPLDEQDAVRQTTRFCIFAAGVLVTVAAVILACTNLPREIENRVIYTVVTKPTSRLEILVGKIVGFAALSALILTIMGVFSWGYLHLQEWRLLQVMQQQLQAGSVEPAAEQTLKHYTENGLLNARTYRSTADVQVMAGYAGPKAEVRWAAGSSEQDILVPFRVDAEQAQAGAEGGMLLAISLPWEETRPLTPDEVQAMAAVTEMAGVQSTRAAVPMGPGITSSFVEKFPAVVQIGFASAGVTEPMELQGQSGTALPDASGRQPVLVKVSPEQARQVLARRAFFVTLSGSNPNLRFAVTQTPPVTLLLPSADPNQPTVVKSQRINPAFAEQIVLLGRAGQNGQQLRGDEAKTAPVGVFAFRNRELPASGSVNIEFRTMVDRQKDDPEHLQQPTLVELSVVNVKSGKVSPPVKMAVESRRTSYAAFPAEYVEGGDFDVVARAVTAGDWIGLMPGGLRLAVGNGSFGLNLAKSYLILWMLSLLVILVAIFTSTFLSWPIAVVLTVVILLGHWGVMQLGEMAAPGVGRQVVSDLFAGAAPAVTETLKRSMEGLSRLIGVLAAFLPDISQFAAMEEISQGSAISGPSMVRPLLVLAIFGLPILGLSYVFFRNKEVAP